MKNNVNDKKNKKNKKNNDVRTFFDVCDSFFTRYERIWFWALFCITSLSCLLLYDPRVSAGGDDSAYIMLAHEFLSELKFVNYQGPLYPIVLSAVEAIFGWSLTAFKTFSVVCMLACIYFMYRAFRNRIPSTLLFITLLLTSFNSHVLYFASQTYSEAFYMFLLSLLLFVFFKYFVSEQSEESFSILKTVKQNLLLAVVMLSVILTRTIGYSLLLSVIAYFILYGKWKNLAWFTICFVICFAVYQIVINTIWDNVPMQASSQAAALLNKDFYKPELGREDLSGFIERFWTNSNQYLSRFFMNMLGLRPTFTPEGYYVKTIPAITIIVYIIGLTALWFSYKKNKYLFFTGLATGTFLIVTFVILHTHWNQFRLIAPAYPLMILLLFSGIYYVLNLPKLRFLQFLIFVPALIFFFTVLSDTKDASAKAGKIENEFSGLTPDWYNYAKASEWAAKNLPKDALVTCRKPSISSIYGKGKKFHGIYLVRSGDFDRFFENWKTDSLNFSLIALQGMNDEMYGAMYGHIEARILLENNYYFVVKDKEFLQQYSLSFGNATIIDSPYKFNDVVNQDGIVQKSIYYPDSLLTPLRRANVTHVLTANLRLNPNIKDGQIINTVERVASFIQEKYPEIFQRVVRIGAPDDEPADIYQINWDAVKD